MTDYALEIRRRDGQVTPVLYNASVYHDTAGTVTGIFASARDVTELKKAEDAIRKAHDLLDIRVKERTAELVETNVRLRTEIGERGKVESTLRETSQYLENLINYANAPIVVWDPHFVITRFNRAFEELTGRTAREIIGQRLEVLFPQRYLDASMAIIRKAWAGERINFAGKRISHFHGLEGVRPLGWYVSLGNIEDLHPVCLLFFIYVT